MWARGILRTRVSWGERAVRGDAPSPKKSIAGGAATAAAFFPFVIEYGTNPVLTLFATPPTALPAPVAAGAPSAFSSLTSTLSLTGFGSIAASPLSPPPDPSESLTFFRAGPSASALLGVEAEEGGGRSRRIRTGPLARFGGGAGVDVEGREVEGGGRETDDLGGGRERKLEADGAGVVVLAAAGVFESSSLSDP